MKIHFITIFFFLHRKPVVTGLLRHPNEHLLPLSRQKPIASIHRSTMTTGSPRLPSITAQSKLHTSAPLPNHAIALPKPHIDTKKFIPILATFDSLAFLTTTSRPSTVVPDLPTFDSKIPPHIKSYTFVRMYKQNHIPSTVSPNSSSTIHQQHIPHPPTTPVWTSTTPKVTDLFSPADGYLNAGEYIHNQKPRFDYKMYLPDGLRDLLQSERDKLRNISLTIGYNYKAHRMWPVTSSRSAHHDEDVYIGRANNPFGHSTRWSSQWVYIYIQRAEAGQPECISRPPTILSLQTMHTRTARAQFSLPWDLRALAFANTVWHRTAWCVPRTSRRYAVCSWCTPPSLIDCLLHIKFLCKCESFLLWFPQFWLNYIRFISRNQKCNSRGKCMISFTNISCSMCVCVCLCWFVYMFRVQLEQIFSARILSQLHDSQCVTQSKHFVCIR